MKEPKVYIETKWKEREGFRYPQPYKYIGDTELTYQIIDNFESIFNYEFSKALKESNAYNSSINVSLFNSDFWTNENAKIQAFNKIYDFHLNGKSGSGSNITPLFPFEIHMMNDGFEMISFNELNAINPGVQIICDGVVNDEIKNPKGIRYGRSYQKGDNFIYLAFGIVTEGKKTNFYFQTSKSNESFQVTNDINLYEKAINGKLKPLNKSKFKIGKRCFEIYNKEK